MDLLDRRQLLGGGLATLGLGLLSGCGVLSASPPRARVARLGFLSLGGLTANGVVDNCKLGLADLGYVEGQHYTVEARYAEGDADLLPALAVELVALSPDVIVAAGTQAITAAAAASHTVPIVMSNRGDPIGGKLVTSLARPDGNITGVSGMAVELSGKRMELLRAAVPGASRVGAIWRSPDASMAAETDETGIAGQSLGVGVQPIEVHRADDFDQAYSRASADRLDGVIMIADPLMDGNRQRLVDLALRYRLPTISSDSQYAAAGGLMSYGPVVPDQQRRLAYYVDKLLKGAKPGDLPIEQPTSFELTINVRTAQAMGLSIPSDLLAQATQVIR